MLCMRLLIEILDLQPRPRGNASKSLEQTQGGGYGKLGACSRRSEDTHLEGKAHSTPSKGQPTSRQRSMQAHHSPTQLAGVRPPRHIVPLPFANSPRSRIRDTSCTDLLVAKGSLGQKCGVSRR